MAKKAKKDYDRDGKLESPSEEYKGSKDKAIKAAKKAKPKKKKKVATVSESTDIKKFISAISTKNYALANKYLQAVVETKILARIDNATDEPLF